MKRANLVLLVFLALLLTPVSAETYVNPETKLQFPATVGALARTEVQDLSNAPGGGAAIHYSPTGKIPAKVTIFVYAPGTTPEQEIEGVEQAMKMSYENLELLEKKPVVSGKHKGVQRRYKLTAEGAALFSEARIYNVGNFSVKLRVTGELKDRSFLQQQADTLMAQILK